MELIGRFYEKGAGVYQFEWSGSTISAGFIGTGIAIKLLWIDAPRLIGTALYLALGWAIAFDFGVVLSMPAPAIALLAAGGLAYTVGGVIYIAKKPNLGLMIGFHELFHLFVIVGSVCHYLMVFLYVL